MKPNNVIANLNRSVKYTGNGHPELKDKAFVFAGATIRRKVDQYGNPKAPFYQAEIHDQRTRTLYIVALEDIELIEE